jgi:hypothetical protein
MADIYIRSIVNTLQRYCRSLKNTKSAESISPTPTLKIIRHAIGKMRPRKLQERGTLSIMQNMKNTPRVRPKLISEVIDLEKRKRYFGTLILEKIAELPRREPIPPEVASEKNE